MKFKVMDTFDKYYGEEGIIIKMDNNGYYRLEFEDGQQRLYNECYLQEVGKYSNYLKSCIESLGEDIANDLLHTMWYNGLITVKQHCDLYYQTFDDYAFDCTFKTEWHDGYYEWLIDFEDKEEGIK